MRRLMLALILLAACATPKPPVAAPLATPPPIATVVPTPPPVAEPSKLDIFVGPNALRRGAWTPNGDVVAISDDALWRFRPGEANGRKITLPPVHSAVSAHGADVTVVLGLDNLAYPFKDGKALATFPIGQSTGWCALSDDGRIFATRERPPGAHEVTRFYELATGKPLATLDWHARMSPDGEFALQDGDISAIDDGTPVVTFGTPGWTRTAAWIDGKVMTWGDDELVIADPKAKSEKRFPAKCPSNATPHDEIDEVNKRAVRWCKGTLFVIGLAETRLETKVDPAYTATHDVWLSFWASLDGTKLILDWNYAGVTGKPIDEVDVKTGKWKRIPKLPPLRAEDEAAQFLPVGLGIDLSPDRKWALSDMTVVDLADRHEVMRRGRPSTPVARTPLEVFIHENGLEIAADLDRAKGPRISRVGPDRTTPFNAPLLEHQAPCPADAYEPNRHISGRDAIFTWPYGGSCVCDPKGCSNPHLPDNTIARRGTRFLREVNPGGVELIDGKTTVPLLLTDPEQAAVFIDDHTVIALTRVWPDKALDLREVALDPAALVNARKIPYIGGATHSVAATARNIVVTQTGVDALVARVFPRGTSTSPLATVLAWPGAAIVQLPNGQIETYGDADLLAPVLACVESDGTVRPFSTCRERFESKGVFRVD